MIGWQTFSSRQQSKPMTDWLLTVFVAPAWVCCAYATAQSGLSPRWVAIPSAASILVASPQSRHERVVRSIMSARHDCGLRAHLEQKVDAEYGSIVGALVICQSPICGRFGVPVPLLAAPVWPLRCNYSLALVSRVAEIVGLVWTIGT